MISIVFWVVNELLVLYRWVIIVAVVLNILISFGVLDTRNRIVWTIGDFFYRATEPALRPIRNALPNFGGIDISPVILLFLVFVVQMLLARVYAALMFGDMRGLLF